MKFLIEQAALVRVLEHVRGVVERRNTIPILSNVLITAVQGKVTITATDLDIEIAESVECDVQTNGTVTAQAHMLFDICRKFPKGAQVCVETSGHGIKLSAGRSKFELAILPPEDFPNMSAGALAKTFSMPAPVLRTMIDKVAIAMSTEETRYYLNGFFFHAHENGTLRAVATDGHRLVRHEVEAPDGCAGMPGVIVPRKTAGELRRLLDGVDGEVTVSLSNVKIRFEFGTANFLSKLIDGTYPPYERVIPQNNPHSVTMATADLAGVVDRAGAILAHGRAICMRMSSDKALFSANNNGESNVTEDVDAEYAGPEIEIGFNYKYLGQLAAGIVGDKVSLALLDAASPAVITDPGDAATLYVLMPMRV